MPPRANKLTELAQQIQHLEANTISSGMNPQTLINSWRLVSSQPSILDPLVLVEEKCSATFWSLQIYY